MLNLFLTKDNGAILGPISALLGKILEWIYDFFSMMSIESVGLCIIVFTIIVRLLLLPLNIKQQKFSKLSALMNPELQAISKKYQDKRDPDSMTKMREETNAVYQKYGTSPTGGCLQLIIQMPILFALWRVMTNIPAYVPKIKEMYQAIIAAITGASNNIDALVSSGFTTQLSGAKEATAVFADCTNADSVIDVMTKFGSENWDALQQHFSGAAGVIADNAAQITDVNTFFGINLSATPLALMGIALLIPVLSVLGQWFSMHLAMKLQQNKNGQDMAGMGSMKVMNNIMPFVSGIMCLSLPAGLGVYWVAGSVIQIIQQLAMNRYFNKIDVNDIVAKNVEKQNKKRAKKGLPPQKVTNAAHVSTRNIEKTNSNTKKTDSVKDSTEYYAKKSPKPGSLAAKANMVQMYNEKQNKKK